MSIATKVIYDQKENTISLEKHQTSPVQLTNQTRASRQPVRSQGTEIVRID
jgi:nitrogen fixation protein FixH